MAPFIVKYDVSILRAKADMAAIARDIAGRASGGRPVIAVLPALRGRRDQLIAAARRRFLLETTPHFAEYVSSGGQESAILALHALKEFEIDVSIATARRIGLVAEIEGRHADPSLLDKNAIIEIFKTASVLIVPGGSAVTANGDHVLLEPSGDITAIHLAIRLGALRMLKVTDTRAICDHKGEAIAAERLARRLSYADALACEIPPVQPNALKRAAAHNISIDIAAPGKPPSLVIDR